MCQIVMSGSEAVPEKTGTRLHPGLMVPCLMLIPSIGIFYRIAPPVDKCISSHWAIEVLILKNRVFVSYKFLDDPLGLA